MYRRLQIRIRGQALPLVAILLATGVLIGFLAIAIDGGSALLQRRTMQNGSDAAVLAGIKLMADNVTVSCDSGPSSCHPTYMLTNSEIYNRVNALAVPNRGGTVGATPSNYAVTVAYHYTDGHYAAAPSDDSLVPAYVDGLAVTTQIANPTIFAKALPPSIVGTTISSLTISAVSAARIFPTCRPEVNPGPTFPFTRFRAALEWEIYHYSNDPLHPYQLWNSQSDFQGNNNNFKNNISLARDSYTGAAQLLSDYDHRYQYPPGPPAGGLCSYGSTCISGLSCALEPAKCANMAGNANLSIVPDVPNWIFWQWNGVINKTSDYGRASMTYFPATQSTNWGRNGSASPSRPGDWAETYIGDRGDNVSQPLDDAIAQFGGPGPLSNYINPNNNRPYGKMMVKDIWVWGEPAPSRGGNNNNWTDNGKGAQSYIIVNTCGNQNPCPQAVWEDITVNGNFNNGGYTLRTGNSIIDRIHFTTSYKFAFYQNLPTPSNANSTAFALLVSTDLPGPNPGTCTPGAWDPGGAVYSRQVGYP